MIKREMPKRGFHQNLSTGLFSKVRNLVLDQPNFHGSRQAFLGRGSRGSRGRKELDFLTINPAKLA